MRELDAEVQRAVRYGHELALVIGDVDDFKLINDTLGHPAGDQALCEVAETLRAGLRTTDAAFRLGGDEFALLLPETTREEAAAVVRASTLPSARRRRRTFADLRISCGFATAPADGADGEALIRTRTPRSTPSSAGAGGPGRRRRRRRPGRKRRVAARRRRARPPGLDGRARVRRGRRRRSAAACR